MEGEAVPAVLSRDRWSVPGALAAGTRGPRAPLGVVLGAGTRVHPTLLVHHPLGWCPGPVVGGFAPGTQPVSRAGEYSGCGVVWCGVVWCGVAWCAWRGVVWGGAGYGIFGVALCCAALCSTVYSASMSQGTLLRSGSGGNWAYQQVQVQHECPQKRPLWLHIIHHW